MHGQRQRGVDLEGEAPAEPLRELAHTDTLRLDAIFFPLGCDMGIRSVSDGSRMTRKSRVWRHCVVLFMGLAGCHFRAGFGPAPAGRPSVDHSLIRDTTEHKDGGKTVHEKDSSTTTREDGRSSTIETTTTTVTNAEGATTRTSTQTTTERSSNGSVTTSSTSSSH